MDRKTYLTKVTKELRNQNIARMYFKEDLSITEIRKDYPELSRQRILAVAWLNKDKV